MTFPARRPSVRRRARASAVVLLCTLALAACGNDDPVPTSGDTRRARHAGHGQAEAVAVEPSETPTSSPTGDDDGTAVPIYWVGDGPGGEPRLFREFHRVQGNPLTEAARLVMGGGQPDDPDYRTLWPQHGGRRRRRDRRDPARADPRRRVHRAPRRDDEARRRAGDAAAGLHAAGRAAGARPDPGQARRLGLPAPRAAVRRALRAGERARDAQPRQHHLARGGRHRSPATP